MGIPAVVPLAHIILRGAVGGDRWNTGFWLSMQTADTTPTQTEVDEIASFCLSSFQTNVWGPASNPLKGVNPSGVTLDSCKVLYYVAGALKSSGLATQTPVAGTSGSSSYHAGAALVCTLQSDFAGRRNRGRMYLPTCAPNAAAASLQWALAPPYAATMKTFFDAVNSHSFLINPGGINRCVIVSQVGSGATVGIASLRMDSIIDSQRGRSNKFVANFQSTATLA